MSKSRSRSPEQERLRGALVRELSALPPLVAAEKLARPGTALQKQLTEASVDRARLIVDLYESRQLAPEARKKHGVFYTPAHVIDALLDRLPGDGEWLDPAAGAGAFLVALVRRHGPILDRLRACDIDPEALDAAAFALEALLGPAHRSAVRTWRKRNALKLDFLRQPLPGKKPDIIVGNPPYGLSGGSDLPRLFPALRGEVDLYACFLLRGADVVSAKGTVSLLVPDTWLTNHRATPLREALAARGVDRIVDFGKPFATARDTRVHAVFLRNGASECSVESLRNGALMPMASVTQEALSSTADQGWVLYRTIGEVDACRRIEQSRPLSAMFDVLYGVRTGANAQHVVSGPGEVPLVAGRDFDPYDRHVVPKHLRDARPFAAAVARQRGRWKLGIQRIRTNSKLSWRRWIEAAPVEPDEVGLDSLTLVADRSRAETPTDALLHALGVLNSSVLNRWYRLSFTDVNVKPVYVERIPMPPVSAPLVALVRRRLQRPGDTELERAIDRLVAHAYGLSDEQLACLEAGFWGDAAIPLPSLDQAQKVAA